MSRFGSFLIGAAVGAGGVYGSLTHHVVRAEDGFHTVPKLSAEFAETYVDIRAFDLDEWNDHRSLAMALVKAERGDLLKQSADESLERSIRGALDAWIGPDATAEGGLRSLIERR